MGKWDQKIVVIGRAQSATYTENCKTNMLTPLIFVYSRPALEKSLSLYGHRKGITCLDLNSNIIISGSLDHTVRIWCRETGETLSVLTNHNEIVTAVHLVTRCHLLSMGLDNKIYRYKITYPDISEDFDSKISCTHLSQNTRNVPEDDGFMMPKRYRQPINSYLKACGCLVTNGKFLISAFKRKINIWEIKSSDITFSWIAHSELIGQLEARGNILVSSGCEKIVKIWNLETGSCLNTLSYEDKFNNVSHPKIALDSRFLLVSGPDQIDFWQADSLSATPVLIRKMPVQELIVDLHLEQRGLAFSCYKSVHIWDFWKIDTSKSLFCGTITRY